MDCLVCAETPLVLPPPAECIVQWTLAWTHARRGQRSESPRVRSIPFFFFFFSPALVRMGCLCGHACSRCVNFFPTSFLLQPRLGPHKRNVVDIHQQSYVQLFMRHHWGFAIQLIECTLVLYMSKIAAVYVLQTELKTPSSYCHAPGDIP